MPLLAGCMVMKGALWKTAVCIIASSCTFSNVGGSRVGTIVGAAVGCGVGAMGGGMVGATVAAMAVGGGWVGVG